MSNGTASIQDLGALLRERREAMGVTLAEVEVATRIRQKYLSALESEEWHLLPGEVVGRGFLRNYAEYLGLEPHEVIERRRAVADSNLASALSSTSAGSPLPPVRQVDYRPKEVDLKDEADGIQRGEIKLTPILSVLALAAVIVVLWWGITRLREPIGEMYANAQARVADLVESAESAAVPTVSGIVNEQNVEGNVQVSGSISEPPVDVSADGASGNIDVGETSATPASNDSVALLPEPTPTSTSAPPTPTPEPFTPTPIPPTATPVPPTPIPPTPIPPTPVPLPTEPPPTPEPPPIVASACADGRSLLSSPGVNQVVAGVVGVSGTVLHDVLQYYKLEYAPGANAEDGFVYFDGRSNPVSGGLLGNLDTRALPNGPYTIRLTVVDQTGNFPPPCDVSVIIQN